MAFALEFYSEESHIQAIATTTFSAHLEDLRYASAEAGKFSRLGGASALAETVRLANLAFSVKIF